MIRCILLCVAALLGPPQESETVKKMLELSVESDMLFKQEKWEECVAKRREALDLAARIGDPWYLSALYNNLGLALTKQGKFEDAEGAYQRGLSISAAEYANVTLRGSYTPLLNKMASNVRTLGATLAIKHGYDKAAECYGRILKTQGASLPYWVRRDLTILHAEASREAKHFEPAAGIFDQIGKLDTAENYPYGAVEMTYGKADAYFRGKLWDRAATAFEETVKSADKIGAAELKAWSEERLAEIHIHKDELSIADLHLRRATQEFKKLGDKAGLTRVYEVWITFLEKRGDPDAAKKYGELLASARDMADPARDPVTIDDTALKRNLPFVNDTNRILEIEHTGDKIVFKNILEDKSPVLWQAKLEYAAQPVYYGQYRFTVTGPKVTLNNRTIFVQKGRSIYVYKNGEVTFSRN